MINQHALTIRASIKNGGEEKLRPLLNAIGDDVIRSQKIPFKQLTTVHYMRFVMLEGRTFGNKEIPPSLVLSTNFDGPVHTHLSQLAQVAGDGLDQIYEHCVDYPDAAKANPESRLAFLKKHTIKTTTFYTGTRGRSVDQIPQEESLFNQIGSGVLNTRAWEGEQPNTVFNAIKKYVWATPALSWARSLSTSYPLSYYLDYYGRLLAVILLLIALLPIILVVSIFIWYPLLRYHETHDTREDQRIPLKRDQVLASREDILLQNQMTHLVDVKPGLFRLFTLKFVLWAVGFLGKYYWNKGNLGGIPTIHFARWVMLDGGKRLLFFSNFDGSWQNYLGDFIDKASVGLTGVWSNAVNFPVTKNLIYAGADAEEPFKRWARFYQIPTQVWYTAYPNISVENINNNSKVRERIGGKSSREKLEDWLRRF